MKGIFFVGLIAVVNLSAPSIVLAQDPPSVEILRARMGSKWSIIRTQNVGSQVVIRELTRPYPDSGEAGIDERTAPAVTTPARAESIAADLLTMYSEEFFQPLALPTTLKNVLAVKEIISTVNKSEFQSRGTDFTVVYAQQHGGVPVFESSMTVGITKNGEVWTVINKLAHLDADIPTNPRITATDALLRARQVLGDLNAMPESDASLYILAPSHLAWRLNFLDPHFKEMMIDATSGDIIWQRKNIRN
jgi:hypothetical protein